MISCEPGLHYCTGFLNPSREMRQGSFPNLYRHKTNNCGYARSSQRNSNSRPHSSSGPIPCVRSQSTKAWNVTHTHTHSTLCIDRYNCVCVCVCVWVSTYSRSAVTWNDARPYRVLATSTFLRSSSRYQCGITSDPHSGSIRSNAVRSTGYDWRFVWFYSVPSGECLNTN
jgi:hypothetical protein